MEPIKEEAKKLIDSLPDDATWEDVMYKIYVRQKVERAEKFVEEGGTTYSLEEAERLLNQ